RRAGAAPETPGGVATPRLSQRLGASRTDMSGEQGTGPEIRAAAELHDGTIDDGNPWRRLLEALPAAVYATDAEGRLTYWNKAAERFWGQRPDSDTSRWCGSWKLFTPSGQPLPHGECPMAL